MGPRATANGDSYNISQVARAVNDAVNFNHTAADHIKDEIRLHHKGPIAESLQFLMTRNPAEARVDGQAADARID